MKKLDDFKVKLARNLTCILFGLFVIFIFISLLTYHEADVPGSAYPLNDTVHNKGGLLGAYLASFLYQHFGLGAFVICIFVAVWAFQLIFKHRVERIYYKLFIAMVCILSFCSILSLQGIIGPDLLGIQSAAISLGGIYGESIKTVSTRNIGPFGSWVFFLTIFTISLILATNWLVYHWGKRAINQLKKGLDEIRKRQRAKRLSSMRDRLEDMQSSDYEDADYTSEPTSQTAQTQTMPLPQTPATLQTDQPVTANASTEPAKKPKPAGPFKLPQIELFETQVERLHKITEEDVKLRRDVIESALIEYGVNAKVVSYEIGPTVTVYELELSPGTRISRISSLSDELAMKLMVPNVRIVAPIPGRGTVGIEVPNPFPDSVRLNEFLKNSKSEYKKISLPVFLGKVNSGDMLIKNLAEMPHILIAGTTGSGKSVCLKSIIMSLTSTKKPNEMKLLLIDPKMVELTAFEDIPHLWAPVITDPKKATLVLDWLVKEMETRYTLFSKIRVMKIDTYNQLGEEEIKSRLKEIAMNNDEIAKIPMFLPYIVVVIDELADLMLVSGKEIEGLIIRIAQKARAVGIHLVAATQRPSADVVTGLIKSNMPSRISFKVASHIESRIILDHKGAERLLGKGDMLVLLPATDSLLRAQCTFTGEDEIKKIVNFLKSQGEPVYHNELIEIDNVEELEGTTDDELFDDAVKTVLESRRGSISLIQRRLGVGYQRAARLMETMEKMGLVGPYNGANPREVLTTPEQWQARKKNPQQ